MTMLSMTYNLAWIIYNAKSEKHGLFISPGVSPPEEILSSFSSDISVSLAVKTPLDADRSGRRRFIVSQSLPLTLYSGLLSSVTVHSTLVFFQVRCGILCIFFSASFSLHLFLFFSASFFSSGRSSYFRMVFCSFHFLPIFLLAQIL